MQMIDTRQSALKEKYGDAQVAVIPSTLTMVAGLNDEWTSAKEAGRIRIGNVLGELIYVSNHQHTMMPRYLAELDPTFKQLIPYVVVRNTVTGDYFVTRRIGGDGRLVGKLSLGIGGHVEEGETLYEGMYREIEEEIGLTNEDILTNHFCGYINDDTSEVNSVHLGLVFCLETKKKDIRCVEEDTLMGEWMDAMDIENFCMAGALESWSEIVFDHLICQGE